MMKNCCYFLLALLCLTLLSCSNSDLFDNEEPTLVVEGWIATNDFPVVMVTTNVMVDTEKNSISSLEDHVIRYAKVTISDGVREVVLTSKYDRKYMPPFIYTTTDMIGKTGRTYTLKVEADPYNATAVTTIPCAVPIDSVWQKRIEKSDSLYQLFVDFTDPDEDNYYCMFYKTGARSVQFNICGVGAFTDQGLQSKVSYPLYKTSNLTETSNNENDIFCLGDTVCVQLANVDRTTYEFWSDFQTSSSLSGNFVVPYTSNVRSNISGGYGYWSGLGSSVTWKIVR